jgi:hypothetical protein
VLLSAANQMREIVRGENCGQALKTVPLSDNAMMQRNGSVLEDIKEQLLTRIKHGPKFIFEIYLSYLCL